MTSFLSSKHSEILECILTHADILAFLPKINKRRAIVDKIGFFDSIRLNAIEDDVLALEITTVGNESKRTGQSNVRLINTQNSKVLWCAVVSFDSLDQAWPLSLAYYLHNQNISSEPLKELYNTILKSMPCHHLQKSETEPKTFEFSRLESGLRISFSEHQKKSITVSIDSLILPLADYLKILPHMSLFKKGMKYEVQSSDFNKGAQVLISLKANFSFNPGDGSELLKALSTAFKYIDWELN